MSSNRPARSLPPESESRLIILARDSIRYGLTHRIPLPVDLTEIPPELAEPRASFVTLTLAGRLRGCIGSLEAVRPLAEDVAHNAFAAAFRDRRFQPVEDWELDRLDIHLSLLTPAEPMVFSSEADLLGQLVPFEDGLILAEGHRRATFLPSVWESLPDAVDFLAHLKQKAGLAPDYWSNSLGAWRYRTEVVEGRARETPNIQYH